MEILNPLQRKILEMFPALPDSDNFYLTGGTALAYFYLKHRKSNDLDFFTSVEEILLPFSFRLEGELKALGLTVQRRRGMHSFVELSVEKEEDRTSIHLGYESPFRIEEVKKFPEFPGLNVDSLIDISVNKLLALFGRATLRDFIDVYFLIKKGAATKEGLIEKAKLKDPGFDIYWLGVSFERINTFMEDEQEMLLLIEKVDFSDLVHFFNQWRKEIAKGLI